MSTQLQKKSKATVAFTGTKGGKLDKSALDSDEHTLSDHFLFGSGENKEDYSYPVVDADKNLRRGNVDSAWGMGARGGVSEEAHARKLKKLGKEFDNNPIPDDAYEESAAEERFERAVEFKQTDGEEQVATGAVLVPDELDTQLDYFRGDTIRDLAENYGERFENGDVYGGVMHSVFPDGAVELAENRVLDESETIGDEHYPEDTWIQSYKFTDDELWSLVADGILSGNSIGGTAKGRVTDPIPDDVRVPDTVADGVPDDADPSELPGREITEGRILEVSAVDQPAVPRATHEQHKSAGLEKGHPALTESVVQARLYLEGRGHPPDDAKRLAEYLQSEKASEDAAGEGGILGRAKALLGRSSGGSGGESALQQSRAPDESAEKDGRTLSRANIASAKALHDTALDMLNRSDVDHGKGRFTDDPSDEFDVGSYGASGDGKSAETAAAESAADTDTDTIPMDEDELNDKFEALNGRLDEIEGKMDSDDEQDEEKSGNEEETDDSATDEKVEQLIENQNRMAGLLEQMADANGVSQQADTDKSDERNGNGQIESMDDLNGVLG